MSVLLKVIHRFSVAPIKIPVAFFTEIENPEIHMEPQKTRNNQAILRKNSKAGASSSWFQARLQSSSNQNSIVLA